MRIEEYVTQEMEKLNSRTYPMTEDYKTEAIIRRSFRAAIELAAQSLERDNDGRVVLWGTADAAKVIRALGGDDCDCNCHKAPPVGWEAGRCCPDCGASITGGRFD